MNQFKERFISNGDKVILFDKSSLPKYLESYPALFSIENKTPLMEFIDTNSVVGDTMLKYGEIERIDDIVLVEDLIPFQRNSDIVGAVLMCCEKYGNQYPDMGLNQWRKLIVSFFLGRDNYDKK
jgi:hypothetical protein